MGDVRCQYCGTERNLITEQWTDEDGFVSDEQTDEDGFVSDEPVDLCHDCVEISEERRKAREEWAHYHDEPCPEIELPQPAPRRALSEDRP